MYCHLQRYKTYFMFMYLYNIITHKTEKSIKMHINQ